MVKASRWLSLFRDFSRDVRIASKEMVSDDERGSPLVLWESQRRFMTEIGQGLDEGIRIFNCLKSRQLGITTICLLIDLFWLAMHPHMKGALVGEKQGTIDENRGILKQYMASFPPNYFGTSFDIVDDNRDFMSFSNGSRINFLIAGTRKKHMAWGEGRGYAFAHLTEIASFGDPAGLASFEEGFAQQNPNRLFIYESTAKGYNIWHEKWTKGLDDVYVQRSFFIGWWASDVNVIPRSDPRFLQYKYAPEGRELEKIQLVASLYGHKITPEQLAWIRYKEQSAGSEQNTLEQNQPWVAEDAFVQSGYSFFSVRNITSYLRKLEAAPPEFLGYRYEFGNSFFDFRLEKVIDENELDRVELRVYEEPVAGGAYVIGMDPAYGRNEHGDRTCISVWRCYADKLVQVAEYATADVEVRFTAWVCAHLAAAYVDCVVNVEIQGPGTNVFQEWDSIRGSLQADMNAERVGVRKGWEDALSQARWYLYTRPDSNGRPSAKGFQSTFDQQSRMMHQFRGAFVTEELIIRSRALLAEMGNVVVDDGGHIGAPESRSGEGKDDRVFGGALAHRAWLDWRKPELIAQGLTYQRVNDEETGAASKIVSRVNDQVYRFLRTQEQLALEPPDSTPAWKRERGLA